MKGLEVTHEEFKAIMLDHEWQKLLVFDKKGNVFVDLKKYSELGHYLPIESEFQSYIVGFTFVKKLYDCPYRTQEDLVCIHPPRPPKIAREVVKKRIPIYKRTELGGPESAQSEHPDSQYFEVEEVIIKTVGNK